MATREWDHRRHCRDHVDARKEFATEFARVSVRLEVRDRKLSETFSSGGAHHANRYNLTSRGAPTSRMGMTTVWRPRVRIAVPNVGDADNTDTSRDEVSKKGTKRKRAPPTKGPCEHGVKPRSKCKVCSGCPHGRLRHQCKECGGASICKHGRVRSHCKECGGASICEHGRQRKQCKECGSNK